MIELDRVTINWPAVDLFTAKGHGVLIGRALIGQKIGEKDGVARVIVYGLAQPDKPMVCAKSLFKPAKLSGPIGKLP